MSSQQQHRVNSLQIRYKSLSSKKYQTNSPPSISQRAAAHQKVLLIWRFQLLPRRILHLGHRPPAHYINQSFMLRIDHTLLAQPSNIILLTVDVKGRHLDTDNFLLLEQCPGGSSQCNRTSSRFISLKQQRASNSPHSK